MKNLIAVLFAASVFYAVPSFAQFGCGNSTVKSQLTSEQYSAAQAKLNSDQIFNSMDLNGTSKALTNYWALSNQTQLLLGYLQLELAAGHLSAQLTSLTQQTIQVKGASDAAVTSAAQVVTSLRPNYQSQSATLNMRLSNIKNLIPTIK